MVVCNLLFTWLRLVSDVYRKIKIREVIIEMQIIVIVLYERCSLTIRKVYHKECQLKITIMKFNNMLLFCYVDEKLAGFSGNEVNSGLEQIVHEDITRFYGGFDGEPPDCLHAVEQLFFWHFTICFC